MTTGITKQLTFCNPVSIMVIFRLFMMLEWSEKELMWPPGLQSSLKGVSHTCRKVTN